MTREAVLRGAEAPEFVLAEEFGDRDGSVLMNTVCAPCGDDFVATFCGSEQGLVVLGSDGIRSLYHLFRVGGAKAEDIGHQKTIESLALGKRSNAREGGVELLLVGCARVEPDPVQQGVAMLSVGGEMTLVFHAQRWKQTRGPSSLAMSKGRLRGAGASGPLNGPVSTSLLSITRTWRFPWTGA
jgi:hypothetical protein